MAARLRTLGGSGRNVQGTTAPVRPLSRARRYACRAAQSRRHVTAVRDPYLNNPIARASVTMAELSAIRTAPVAMAAE